MNLFSSLLLLTAISSSSTGNKLLRNFCLSFEQSCLNDGYVRLTPSKFNPDIYNYTIHIPNMEPLYPTEGSMWFSFYVSMNISTHYSCVDCQPPYAKAVLFDATGTRLLTQTEIAYSSDELMSGTALLWRPQDQVKPFDTENQVVTRLIVFQFIDHTIQQSDSYTFIFKRNE